MGVENRQVYAKHRLLDRELDTANKLVVIVLEVSVRNKGKESDILAVATV